MKIPPAEVYQADRAIRKLVEAHKLIICARGALELLSPATRDLLGVASDASRLVRVLDELQAIRYRLGLHSRAVVVRLPPIAPNHPRSDHHGDGPCVACAPEAAP